MVYSKFPPNPTESRISCIRAAGPIGSCVLTYQPRASRVVIAIPVFLSVTSQSQTQVENHSVLARAAGPIASGTIVNASGSSLGLPVG